MRARGRFAVIFFIASLAASASLLAGACDGRRAGVERRRGSQAAAGGEARKLSPLPERELSPALASVRERVMRRAAEARGLQWRAEPGMIELTGWEYGTRAREMTAALGGDELRSLSRLATAGGLLPDGTDLATLAAGFTASASSAIYSPLDRRVLLLKEGGKQKRPADESLLAHELTHALQDQHFELLRLLDARPYDFDRAEAVFAVVEGDATNVQRRIEGGEAWSRLTPEAVARSEGERFGAAQRELGAIFPPLLTETFLFRYRDGAGFVETVRRRAGARGVDELFRRPPASSEQVLHPEKYFAGEGPREVRADEARLASAGWGIAAATPLGEIGARGLLLKAVGRREAERAASGWGGDRAYLFERADKSALFVWQTAWDTPEDAREFFRAYNALQRSRGGTGDAAPPEGSPRVWREGELLTLVRAAGDRVTVLRGREPDVRAALELASGF
ncbi:MAG: hypothetical protein LC800_17550 [Acidobacteria bacterium]|nr:hypothetical protein [Acidobacteriota bacterium]